MVWPRRQPVPTVRVLHPLARDKQPGSRRIAAPDRIGLPDIDSLRPRSAEIDAMERQAAGCTHTRLGRANPSTQSSASSPATSTHLPRPTVSCAFAPPTPWPVVPARSSAKTDCLPRSTSAISPSSPRQTRPNHKRVDSRTVTGGADDPISPVRTSIDRSIALKAAADGDPEARLTQPTASLDPFVHFAGGPRGW